MNGTHSQSPVSLIVCVSLFFFVHRYLRIQLEDLDNCSEAMEYISRLPFKDVRGGGREGGGGEGGREGEREGGRGRGREGGGEGGREGKGERERERLHKLTSTIG